MPMDVHTSALLRAASMLRVRVACVCEPAAKSDAARHRAVRPTSGERAAREPELVSVRPGVNDSLFQTRTRSRRWTAEFEVERRDVIAPRDEIVAALGLAPGMIVADIGAGTGAFSGAAERRHRRRGKLVRRRHRAGVSRTPAHA